MQTITNSKPAAGKSARQATIEDLAAQLEYQDQRMQECKQAISRIALELNQLGFHIARGRDGEGYQIWGSAKSFVSQFNEPPLPGMDGAGGSVRFRAEYPNAGESVMGQTGRRVLAGVGPNINSEDA